MRRWWLLVCLVCCLPLPQPAHAEDGPNPDELRTMYASAMDQLKAAQERKNQLSTENEALKAKLAAMQKQLDDSTARLSVAQRELSDVDMRTYQLRAECAAFHAFLQCYPNLWARWKIFVEADAQLQQLYDPRWPLSVLN